MVSATSTATAPSELIQRYRNAGQEHLFRHWDDLSPLERDRFKAQLEAVDVDAVLKEYQAAKRLARQGASSACPSKPLPLDPSQIVTTDDDYDLGLQVVRGRRLAVVTLAGGQGTRLGSADPKGCYRIGLPSGASLFELQAGRLRKLASLAGTDRAIPWYIMTSNATHARTEAFFREHNYFGLPVDSVHFFRQAELPAISEEGHLFLANKCSLALSPNGNGGIYAALKTEGILQAMRSSGIQYVHMFCVDNALVRPADPFFVGACVAKGTDCGIKSIVKVDPKESVGVLCRQPHGTGKSNDRMMVAEYSELDPEWAAMRDASGRELLLNQANIANHFFTMDFLERVCREASLPAHLAHKKIPSIDPDTGEPLAKAPMGYKLEYFIFDVLSWAERPLVFQGERSKEFAPLKNAPGALTDSPDYCVRMVCDLHRRWLTAAGAQVADGAPVEISPALSYAGEGLQAFKGQIVSGYLQ